MKSLPEFLFNLAALAAVAAAAYFFPRTALAVLAPSLLLTLVLMAAERIAGRN
jgi:hypothetical protein